jgi:hypothetical protein
MPAAEQLPATLQALARCQAVELGERRWREDADRLIAGLQAQFAIESEAPALTAGAGGAMSVFSRFALDMLELVTHPRRLIARRQTGHALDHVRAFLFLLACLLLGNFALMLGFGVGEPVSWLLIGILFGIILIMMLSVPLTLAWRVWGARTDFRQVTLIFAYIYGGAWLGFCAGALLVAMGMQVVDGEVFDRYLAIFRLPFPLADRVLWGRALLDSTLQGPAVAMAVVAALMWLIAAVWAVVAWGAFRITYNVGRLRAFGATLSWIGLLGMVVALAGAASELGQGAAPGGGMT